MLKMLRLAAKRQGCRPDSKEREKLIVGRVQVEDLRTPVLAGPSPGREGFSSVRGSYNSDNISVVTEMGVETALA
jgi:hypothetical protein